MMWVAVDACWCNVGSCRKVSGVMEVASGVWGEVFLCAS